MLSCLHFNSVQNTYISAGQNGYHHRTEINKKVYKIGKAGQESHDASTEFDRLHFLEYLQLQFDP